MAAPDFDLAIFTVAGKKTTTSEALDSAMQTVLDAVWAQMHTLTGRGLIDTINAGGTANAITAALPSSHAEVAITAGGGTFSISPVGTNTGNVTLSIGGETALPLRDAGPAGAGGQAGTGAGSATATAACSPRSARRPG